MCQGASQCKDPKPLNLKHLRLSKKNELIGRSKNIVRKDLVDKKVIRNLLKLTHAYFKKQTKPKSIGISKKMIERLVAELKIFIP